MKLKLVYSECSHGGNRQGYLKLYKLFNNTVKLTDTEINETRVTNCTTSSIMSVPMSNLVHGLAQFEAIQGGPSAP